MKENKEQLSRLLKAHFSPQDADAFMEAMAAVDKKFADSTVPLPSAQTLLRIRGQVQTHLEMRRRRAFWGRTIRRTAVAAAVILLAVFASRYVDLHPTGSSVGNVAAAGYDIWQDDARMEQDPVMGGIADQIDVIAMRIETLNSADDRSLLDDLALITGQVEEIEMSAYDSDFWKG